MGLIYFPPFAAQEIHVHWRRRGRKGWGTRRSATLTERSQSIDKEVAERLKKF
jgi:hypothetical protein